MNQFGNALLIAMPGFFVLIMLEMFWGRWKHNEQQPLIDSIASIASGMTNILKATLGLTIVILSYSWMESHLHLMRLSANSAWTYVIAFVALDFVNYWGHRLSHRVNFFWGHHVVHHSSEEFNLPCALRQGITMITNLTLVFILPLALLGVPAKVLAIVAPVHLFAQFWYHTRYIGQLGVLEYILMTPSAHRVHHAMNDIYMDKNYSAIFIVWDRMFGTYQEELDTEPCVYGMRRPAQSWNPIIMNYKHWYTLAVDAYHTKNWRDKFKLWFMPTGWRPADVAEKYPLFTIQKMSDLNKYNPGYSKWFTGFSFIHINAIFLLVLFLFFRFGEISKPDALANGIFLLLAIFGFTSLLDKKQYGFISMMLISASIAIFGLVKGDWFGLNTFVPFGSVLVVTYFTAVAFTAGWFYKTEFSLASRTKPY
jgi:sterol desaturase/sphingolipid hydroxylase (fatty acid hydroxylase superfamily)